MDDGRKVWTTVGSAGTLDQTDLAKVHLLQSMVQLGTDLGGPLDPGAQGAGATPNVDLPTSQAIVRYNITPVEGLFFIETPFKYQIRIRYRGRVAAKLMQVNIESGAETQLILFDSSKFPSTDNFQVQSASASADSPLLDFVNNAYYVEATLTASAVALGHPAAISMIKVEASADFSG